MIVIRKRERGRDIGRGRSRLHAPGARCGIRSRVSRIARPGPKAGAKPLCHPGIPGLWFLIGLFTNVSFLDLLMLLFLCSNSFTSAFIHISLPKLPKTNKKPPCKTTSRLFKNNNTWWMYITCFHYLKREKINELSIQEIRRKSSRKSLEEKYG